MALSMLQHSRHGTVESSNTSKNSNSHVMERRTRRERLCRRPMKLWLLGCCLLVFQAMSRKGPAQVLAASPRSSSIIRHRSGVPFLSSITNRVGVLAGEQGDEISIKNLAQRNILLQVRGGGSVDDSDEEDYDDEDEDEDMLFDLDDVDAMNDAGVAESDFAEDNTLDRMIDAFKKTPPFTKAYLSASFAATLYGYLFNKNQFPQLLLLEWKPVLRKLQIWRLLTSFLNFGPMGLGYIMTAHFVWTYMSTLERLNHNKPYDFWIMTLFGQLSMVIGYPLLRLSPGFLGHNLSTFFVYIWSRYHEGIQVSMVSFSELADTFHISSHYQLSQTNSIRIHLPSP